MIKIGWSACPPLRLRNLAAWSPEPLDLLVHTRGNMRDERALHKRYIDRHSHHEWFRASPEMLADIELIKKVGKLPKEFRGARNEPDALVAAGLRLKRGKSKKLLETMSRRNGRAGK